MERAGLGRSGVENLAASRPEAGVVRIIARIDESLSTQLRASPPYTMHKSPHTGAQCGIVCPGFGPQVGGLAGWNAIHRFLVNLGISFPSLRATHSEEERGAGCGGVMGAWARLAFASHT